MAAVIVFRNHLINNLQLPAAVVSQIIDIHGYDSIDEFASATDREIRDLISTMRKTPSVANNAACCLSDRANCVLSPNLLDQSGIEHKVKDRDGVRLS